MITSLLDRRTAAGSRCRQLICSLFLLYATLFVVRADGERNDDAEGRLLPRFDDAQRSPHVAAMEAASDEASSSSSSITLPIICLMEWSAPACQRHALNVPPPKFAPNFRFVQPPLTTKNSAPSPSQQPPIIGDNEAHADDAEARGLKNKRSSWQFFTLKVDQKNYHKIRAAAV